MDFDARVTGLDASVRRLSGARRVVGEELTRAVDRSTFLGVAGSRTVVPVDTGRLRGSIAQRRATFAGGAARGAWGTNVDYARAVEFGRGPVVARNARALRFVINGQVLFRTRVGPARPRPFLFNTFARLKPRFRQEFDQARRRIVARLSGGG